MFQNKIWFNGILLGVFMMTAQQLCAQAENLPKRPIEVADLFKLVRITEPQVSPNGQTVVWVETRVDLEGNKSSSSLWVAPVGGGKDPIRLTFTEKKDRHPRWSPNGKWILFESNRSGDMQIWALPMGGGEARQLSKVSTGATNAIWSDDGKKIAFVSTVYPEFSTLPFKESDDKNKKKEDDKKASPIKAKVFNKLFYRHWDEYVEDKRQHLFVMDFEASGKSEPKDVTPGDRDANPTSSTFSVGDDFTFSPDSSHLIFTAVPATKEAWSTDFSLCRIPVTGGTEKWEELFTHPAAEGSPQFSPDGKTLAFRRQMRPGFEADRWTLCSVPCSSNGYPTGEITVHTKDLDRSIDEFSWLPENDGWLAAFDENGYKPAVGISLKGEIHYAPGVKGSGSYFSVHASGKSAVALRTGMNHPGEVVRIGGPKPEILSPANKVLLSQISLPRPESVTVPIEGGTMQMWILKPPSFDETKKWPLVFLVHGGPQGAWEDGWSYRWNPQMWAARGYVVAAPNPRGSTGFGQKFCDEISGDWGGKCYDDLMKGMDHLEKLSFVDSKRMASAGASFGGYMMNWFQGKTKRFKTLITHCGVYNFESMYATTEELWFDEWEHGGPPWGTNKNSYEKHSPHKLAAQFATPMLIIHNDLDFRVPVSEGHQLFTTLQRLGVKSRFVNFPDEGHWVVKPKNSEYWHKEVFDWLQSHVAPGPK